MSVRTFHAIIYKEQNLFVAECLEVETASQGINKVEALLSLKEATEIYLEEFPVNDIGGPFISTFDIT